MGMNFDRYDGEPFGRSDGDMPSEVLLPSCKLTRSIPMVIALTKDMAAMILVDSVDYYQFMVLNKSQATRLAVSMMEIADSMVG